MTVREELVQVDAAIEKLLATGQAYQIGSRKLTRPEYAALLKRKAELESTLAADDGSGFFGDMYVAIFDGR